MSNTRLIIVGVVTLVCLYLVVPTARYFSKVASLPATPTEQQRKELGAMLAEQNMITLGLDLRGGVDFLLSVDTSRLLRRSLESEVDGLRRRLQEEGVDATVALEKDANRITFRLNDPTGENYAREAIQRFEGGYQVTGLEELKSGTVRITPNEAFVVAEANRAFEGALKVVENRVDSLGLVNPVVVRQGADRIRVQIPGQTDPERVRNTLLRAAELEFRLLHPEHDSAIQPFVKPGTFGGKFGTGIIKDEFLEPLPEGETGEARPGRKPVVRKLRSDIAEVPAGYVLRLGTYKSFDPATGAVKEEVNTLAYLVSEKVDLTGDNLVRAAATTDFNDLQNPVVVDLEFNRSGTAKFREVTTNNTLRRFAILLDDVVYSSPVIREPIPNGRCRISGGFSQVEAHDLSLVLKAGALKAPLRVVEEMAIGPSLGQESIRDSIKAMFLGFVFLTVFMIYTYRAAGAIAIIAMMLNVLMVLAFLSMTGASLNLAGIGGLLLTMGMAVDANVLIYERIREELRDGKPMRAAINGAFSRVFSVIIDSNITNLLPALVLVSFEVVQGSVKGFWLALAVGLIANLYTGLTVTRALVEYWYERTKGLSVGTLRFLANVNVEWLGPRLRKSGMIASGVITLVSIGYLGLHGPNKGVDFTGGVVAQVRVDGAGVEQVRAALLKKYEDSKVVKIVNSENFLVTVKAPQSAAENIPAFQEEFRRSLDAAFPGKATVLGAQTIAPQIGSEFVASAGVMVLITVVIITGYLAVRFQAAFGIAAAVALLHDVFLSLGVFTLLGKPLTMDIVSALLVILGYSVNDTIVVFDRVRDEMQEHPTMDLAKLFSQAINLTLGRTMFTGVTVLLTLLSLYIFGGAALSDFAFILILGIVWGTYSSIFIASVIAWWMLSRKRTAAGGDDAPVATRTTSAAQTVSMLGATD